MTVLALGIRRPARVVERNARYFRQSSTLVLSGALEPLFFLLSARIGISALVGDLPAPGGRMVSYTSFLAPALLASSAANGAIFDTTYNFFHKLRYEKTYDSMLATPMSVRDVALGELLWALLRGGLHAITFIVVLVLLGLVASWWSLLLLPGALLVSWAFAGLGLAATTHVRHWRDFDWQQLVWLPMFLLSASFFPLSVYPEWSRWLVQATPLYQGVALLRALLLGGVDWATLGHAVYLAVLGALCLRHAAQRMAKLLLH